MENKLQMFIKIVKGNVPRNDLNKKLLEMLLQKQEELGEDPTDEECEAAVCQAFREHLRVNLEPKWDAHPSNAEEDIEDNKTDALIHNDIALVREVFNDMGLRFKDYLHKGAHVFSLHVCENGNPLMMKVYLEGTPKLCRMEAIYPFIADRNYVYSLCKTLLHDNYPCQYGTLQYNTLTGKLFYRYSFPMTHGLYEDDFRQIFLAIVKSAMESYDTVRKYAIL